MTGYGKAETSLPGRKITVEVRSLNSKQLDLSVKLPSQYRPWEYEIRNNASRGLSRGKVEVSVSVENLSAAAEARINRELFVDYYAQLADIGNELGSGWDDSGIMAAILRLPDVVRSEQGQVPEAEKKALAECVDRALANINEFRSAEGAVLIADLLERIDKIMELLGKIAPYEGARAEAIRNRIRESIEKLGLAVDENRLEQEMIFYIEKIDITEEKVRLANHCNYFRQVAEKEEDAGRKLGFISQEIGREINALGSKANEANIQKIVVEMKDELEKIKEQILNIL